MAMASLGADLKANAASPAASRLKTGLSAAAVNADVDQGIPQNQQHHQPSKGCYALVVSTRSSFLWGTIGLIPPRTWGIHECLERLPSASNTGICCPGSIDFRNSIMETCLCNSSSH
jgi:hypothetical protein